MNILQVNYYDNLGGAARIAWLLHQGYRARGHQSWMAAGIKFSQDPFVKQIPPTLPPSDIGKVVYTMAEIANKNHIKIGSKNLAGLFRRIADPSRYIHRNEGFEDFDFPESRLISSFPDQSPDIVHLHNLHLNYFDLTYLPELTNHYPTIMTLHDMWPLTGHCAHSIECQRWKTGCGECPHLDIYPAMKHDQTAYNWNRKKEIYSKSKLYLTAPSNWIVETARKSMLAPAIVKYKVIPNGIDLKIFHPLEKSKARDFLGLPQDTAIFLFVSDSGIQKSSYKDYFTIQKAIEIVSHKTNNKKLLIIALGDKQSNKKIGEVEIKNVSHIDSAEEMAKYYQAADIYLHAAKADTFPTVILEAQACGTPVIATSVGGIPDTIIDGETGFLTKAQDPQDMAESIIDVLNDHRRLTVMGMKAAQFAAANFGVDKMVQSYLSFYEEILNHEK